MLQTFIALANTKKSKELSNSYIEDIYSCPTKKSGTRCFLSLFFHFCNFFGGQKKSLKLAAFFFEIKHKFETETGFISIKNLITRKILFSFLFPKLFRHGMSLIFVYLSKLQTEQLFLRIPERKIHPWFAEKIKKNHIDKHSKIN